MSESLRIQRHGIVQPAGIASDQGRADFASQREAR